MASVVYALCALTSLICAGLLLRTYRSRPAPLLLWSGFAFIALTVNNVLLFVDLVIVPDTDLSLARSATAAAGVMIMLGGLIWEGKN
jgi:hypothetical protein